MGTMTLTPACDTAAWALARTRVDAQLRACGVRDAVIRDGLRAEIIAAVRPRHALTPDEAPADLAAGETQRRFAAWIETLFGPGEASASERFARGRAAVHLAHLADLRPDLMLATRPVPDDIKERIRALHLAAGPDFTFTNMAPRPIDLGPISSMADETWRTFARWPVLRGIFIGVLFFSLLGTAFYLVRF